MIFSAVVASTTGDKMSLTGDKLRSTRDKVSATGDIFAATGDIIKNGHKNFIKKQLFQQVFAVQIKNSYKN